MKITLLIYNKEDFHIKYIKDLTEIDEEEFEFIWIKIDKCNDLILEGIRKKFNIHYLVIEDILSKNHRPKVEDYGKYLHVIANDLHYDDKKEFISCFQLNLLVGDNYFVSFHENENIKFEHIVERLKIKREHLKENKTLYISYVVLDTLVDEYFHILEKVIDKIEHLEDKMIIKSTEADLFNIKKFKKQIMILRKAIWPLKQGINKFLDVKSLVLNSSIDIFFKDLEGHITHLMDTIESIREITTEMMSFYMSMVSNKMNDIMKVLTIVSVIFMPLNLIVGIYGMNFINIPGLNYKYGFFITSISMIIITAVLFMYFKKKKWM